MIQPQLAGLHDRWGWAQRAEHALERAGHRATSLLLVAVDGFHRITEVHGQLAADTVLRGVVTALRGALRSTDVAGRHEGHGGDEVLVLLPARDRQLGELIARRIQSRVRRAIIPVRTAGGGATVITRLSTPVGIAVSDPSTTRPLTLTELLQQADAALLQARTSGGEAIVVAGGGVRLAG